MDASSELMAPSVAASSDATSVAPTTLLVIVCGSSASMFLCVLRGARPVRPRVNRFVRTNISIELLFSATTTHFENLSLDR